MGHSFLMDGGIWIVEGNWLEKNQDPQTVTGKTIVSWDRDNWFSMVTNLNFVNRLLKTSTAEASMWLTGPASRIIILICFFNWISCSR